MGVDLYTLRAPSKCFIAIGRDGKPVRIGLITYLCKSGDEDADRYYDKDSKRYAALIQGRMTKAETAWSSVAHDWPRLVLSAEKPKDGGDLIGWPEAKTVEADCCWTAGGILRFIPGRDGSKNWVVFPDPTCFHCGDTGIVSHFLMTYPYPEKNLPGMLWEGGEACECNGGGAEAAARYAAYKAKQQAEQRQERQEHQQREVMARKNVAAQAKKTAEDARKVLEAAEAAYREAQRNADAASAEAYEAEQRAKS